MRTSRPPLTDHVLRLEVTRGVGVIEIGRIVTGHLIGGRSLFSDTDDSSSSSDFRRRSRKRHRSPSSSRSPRRSRRPRQDSPSFLNKMKELMSSVIGDQIRAVLLATDLARPVVPTTPSDLYVYGDGLQSSAAMGGSPVVVVSQGIMSTGVASPLHIVSDEALPPVPGQRSADPEGDVEAVLADPSEQMPASFLDALSAVYKYLSPDICPAQPAPPPRVTFFYKSDIPSIPHKLPTCRLPFRPLLGVWWRV